MDPKTRAPLHTPLCDLLGIRYPICQAGMAFVARSSLAGAVSAAGEGCKAAIDAERWLASRGIHG